MSLPIRRVFLFLVLLGNLKMIKYLLEQGFAVNRTDPRGFRQATALRYAAKNGYEDIAKYLIDHGGNTRA